MLTDQSPSLEAQEMTAQEMTAKETTAKETTARKIESRIFTFIQEELLSPGVAIDRDSDLLSGEILDSIAVVRLGAFVEEEFEIAIQPSDFVIENFQNIAVLAEYVRQATDHEGRSAVNSRE